ncbi:MAG: N-acetyltransferase family protein [Gemmatimonadaceae bacterium]
MPSSPEAPATIRLATPADWPALWSIIAEIVRTGDTYTMPPDVSEAAARAFWMGPGLHTYVAEQGREIAGTYVMRPNQPGLGSHVANAGYMVPAAFAGRGIGRLLAEHSFEAARAAGFRGMQFNAVVSTNTRAVALWQALGFAIIGTVPRGFRHSTLGFVDLHIMYRDL